LKFSELARTSTLINSSEALNLDKTGDNYGGWKNYNKRMEAQQQPRASSVYDRREASPVASCKNLPKADSLPHVKIYSKNVGISHQ
jgi:hypothetical protein